MSRPRPIGRGDLPSTYPGVHHRLVGVALRVTQRGVPGQLIRTDYDVTLTQMRRVLLAQVRRGRVHLREPDGFIAVGLRHRDQRCSAS